MEENADVFVRNYFKDGMLLSAADLTDLQNYLDSKRWLGNCRLMGYGIVFGLTAENSFSHVTINPGFAIDYQGREIYLPTAASISVNSLFSNMQESGEYFLCIEYNEEFCGEAFVINEKKLRETVYNRIRETFKFTVKSLREDESICVAAVVIETHDGAVQISSLRSPVDFFHFAPVWEKFLPRHKYGSVYIGKDDLPDEDGVFRTKEIYHGLGCGNNIVIELSVKSYDKWRACEIFGDSRLFESPVRAAAKLYPESGTCVIAVKPRRPMKSPICVRWHAYSVKEDDAYV